MTKRPDIIRNEVGPVLYDEFWRRNPNYIKEHPYVQPIVDMLKKLEVTPENVLEVGAGFGFTAKKIIEELKLSVYTVYEFSSAMLHLRGLMSSLNRSCKVNLMWQTFENIKDANTFDCIIALEVFEHICWDLDFIGKLAPGTKVFFSVPSKAAKLHVRHFENDDEIYERYDMLLDIKKIEFVPHKWRCVSSVVKGIK